MALWFLVLVLGLFALFSMDKIPCDMSNVEADNRLVAIAMAIISFYFVFTSESPSCVI